MGQAKQRKFNSVEEIFQTYVPGYVPARTPGQQHEPVPLDSESGIRLAQDLLKRFREQLCPKSSRRAQ